MQMQKLHSYKHLFVKAHSFVQSVVRVNHAGELGARQIYRGQICALKTFASKNSTFEDKLDELQHMLEGELKHLDYFTNWQPGFRPSLFNGIWQNVSFLLGFGSMALGYKTAMLLTYSVESVIETHYTEQITQLTPLAHTNPILTDLLNSIKQFLAEEIEHKHCGNLHSHTLPKLYSTTINTIFTSIVHLAIQTSKNL